MILIAVQNYRRRPWYEEYLGFLFEIPWIPILLVFLILLWIFKRSKKDIHSHWNTLIDNFSYSSKDFYTKLRAELGSHNIKGITVSSARLKEGGLASSWRLYLRVEWKEYRYDICCAPFGSGLFLSWWLVNKTSIGQTLVSRIPFIGSWLNRKLFPITYYKIDTASMFMTYCHSAMLKVIDDITKEQGIRLPDADRKPILKDIFKR